MNAKKWIGEAPQQCDICKSKIEDCFIDGRTSIGPWANMCEECFRDYGVGLGIGFGQMYKLSGKDWLKVDEKTLKQ